MLPRLTKPRIATAAIIIIVPLAGILGITYDAFHRIQVELSAVGLGSPPFRLKHGSTTLETTRTLNYGNISNFLNSLEFVDLRFNFSIINRSRFPLAVRSFDYRLLVGGITVRNGTSPEGFSLDVGGADQMAIQYTIDPSTSVDFVGAIASSQGFVTVELAGVAHFQIPFPMSIPVSTSKRYSVMRDLERAWRHSIGTEPSISAAFTQAGMEVSHVTDGSNVEARVNITFPQDFLGTTRVTVLEEAPPPIADVISADFPVEIRQGDTRTLTVSFVAHFRGFRRGYYVEVRYDSKRWTMPDSYPPRLRVLTRGGLSLSGPAIWVVDGQQTTTARVGDDVEVHVNVAAGAESVAAFVTVTVMKEMVQTEDEELVSLIAYVSLSGYEQGKLVYSFSPDQRSGPAMEGYYVKISCSSWASTWIMDEGYPPRLQVV